MHSLGRPPQESSYKGSCAQQLFSGSSAGQFGVEYDVTMSWWFVGWLFTGSDILSGAAANNDPLPPPPPPPPPQPRDESFPDFMQLPPDFKPLNQRGGGKRKPPQLHGGQNQRQRTSPHSSHDHSPGGHQGRMGESYRAEADLHATYRRVGLEGTAFSSASKAIAFST